jgi:DNA repair protein RadA/Sms
MTDPIRADRVKAEKVSWLWRERIPYGMLSVVAGRPDQGKGLFAAHVAAEASRKGIRVLYSAAEDSHGLMTRPRLEAAEAKLENIHLARFTLPRDFTWLTEQVVKHRTRLIIIDPLASHLGGGVSRHSDNIRTVTGPLAALAERTNCAVIIVEHALKKVGAGSHPLNAIGGSGSGLPAAARIAYLFGADPDDPDRRILAVAKCNIREKPEAIAFESDVKEIAGIGEVPVLVYNEEVTGFDATSLVVASRPNRGGASARPGPKPDKRAAAAEWLTNYLAAAGGPVTAKKVIEDAKHYGMSGKTLKRASVDMKVIKTGGPGGTWDLNEDVKDAMGLTNRKAQGSAPVVPDPEEATKSMEDELDKMLKEMGPDGSDE